MTPEPASPRAIGNSRWQLGDAVFLAVVFAQFGFLGHDAGHSQVFRTRQANAVLVLGGSRPATAVPTPRSHHDA